MSIAYQREGYKSEATNAFYLLLLAPTLQVTNKTVKYDNVTDETIRSMGTHAAVASANLWPETCLRLGPKDTRQNC